MCDELWVFGEEISQGMSKEICFAEERGIPIKHFSDCEEDDVVEVIVLEGLVMGQYYSKI